jgi:hypothetical protein
MGVNLHAQVVRRAVTVPRCDFYCIVRVCVSESERRIDVEEGADDVFVLLGPKNLKWTSGGEGVALYSNQISLI